MSVGTGSIKRAAKAAGTEKSVQPSAKSATKKEDARGREERKTYGITQELPYYLL